MSHLTINTRVRRLIHYIEDIEKGLVQIPEFQRDFVWEAKDMLDFFDSLKRNYPIGSILFWQPESEEFGKAANIGPYRIPQERENFFYVLDGFQRLSTLFGCLINPDKTNLDIIDESLLKKFRICYDLENEEFFIPRSTNLENYQVNIYQLIDTRATFAFERSLREKGLIETQIEIYLDRYEKLGTTIIDYQLPSIDIIGGAIDEAVEIFSRVNSRGKDISTDWMVSALSYDKGSSFRLGDEITRLTNDLSYYGWNNLKRDVIFNCIINSFGKYYIDQSKRIEHLAKQSNFPEKTRIVFIGIKKAVKFLFEELLVVDDKLLPYNNQLVFITDFFVQVELPTEEQLKALKNWFWQTSLTNYFTIYSLSKQRLAYNHFQKFINGETLNPLYNHNPQEKLKVTDWPSKINFGSVRAKSILLFLLNYSNDWKPYISVKEEGCDIYYLYDNYPASTLILLRDGRTKFKDPISFIENISDPWLYILNIELLKRILNGDVNAIKERRDVIMDFEKDFSERLNLEYFN